MFESCSTISMLNQQRAQAYQSPNADITLINNEYNSAKKRILRAGTAMYTVLPRFTPSHKEFPKASAIPIVGYNDDKNKITMTERGFLI